ncbi:MAG: hypothetical protein WC783_02615 [Candidatus Paceibacterota bacterium]|jgi:hypothetical protein
MSFDFKITALCNHIQKEYVYLEPDLRTFKLKKASLARDVALFRNNVKVLPNNSLYGWSIITDRDGSSDFYNNNIATSTLPFKRSIQLNNITKNTDDLWMVTYPTNRDYCERCASKGILKDGNLDKNGDIAVVRGTLKLAQELEKYALTIKSSNKYYIWYGTIFESLIGRAYAARALMPLIVSESYTLVDNIQKEQLKKSRYLALTEDEKIKKLLQVNVTNPTIDSVSIKIEIESAASRSILTDLNYQTSINMIG